MEGWQQTQLGIPNRVHIGRRRTCPPPQKTIDIDRPSHGRQSGGENAFALSAACLFKPEAMPASAIRKHLLPASGALLIHDEDLFERAIQQAKTVQSSSAVLSVGC